MQIITHGILHYTIQEANGATASILYEDSSFAKAELKADVPYCIELATTGTWVVRFTENDSGKLLNTIRTQPAGSMTITTFYRRKKYHFRRSQNHKLRFALMDINNDELMSILPVMVWGESAPHFTLQINEDFEKECTSFLILQALHCALCCLSMMTGGDVPALVSI